MRCVTVMVCFRVIQWVCLGSMNLHHSVSWFVLSLRNVVVTSVDRVINHVKDLMKPVNVIIRWWILVVSWFELGIGSSEV